MKYEKGTFITVPAKGGLRGLHPTAQVLYMWLCSYANETGDCFPSRTTLAKDCGCSEKMIDKMLMVLQNQQLLKKVQRRDGVQNLTNIYTLMVGGGAPYTVGGALSALGVGHDVRRELNPSLTQSTQHGADAPIEVVLDKPKPDLGYKEVFKIFSPSKQGWMFHKAQIDAAKRLHSKPGVEKVRSSLEFYREHAGEKGCPDIHTPYDLEAKIGKLTAFKRRL